MASGKQHDKLIVQYTPVWGIFSLIAVIALGLPFRLAALSAIAFLGGGLFLSPDLDCRSLPFKRWGWLRWYWVPYQRAIPHRGISHAVLLGSAGRLAYLCAPLVLVLAVQGGFGAIGEWALLHRYELAAVFMGCEVSAWVHLVADL